MASAVVNQDTHAHTFAFYSTRSKVSVKSTNFAVNVTHDSRSRDAINEHSGVQNDHWPLQKRKAALC